LNEGEGQNVKYIFATLFWHFLVT